jgi:hypothetical protein
MSLIELLKTLSSTTGNLLEITKSSDGAFTPDSNTVYADFSYLKFSEDTPNVSLTYTQTGVVTLPQNEFGVSDVETTSTRTFSLIKNGNRTCDVLPIQLSEETHAKLVSLGMTLEPFVRAQTTQLDITLLPVTNALTGAPYNAFELCSLQFELYKLKTRKKVLSSLIEKEDNSFSEKYSSEQIQFLKEHGITSSGYSPKYETQKYEGASFEIKLSSLSSIPKVKDVQAAIESNKTLTPSMQVMADVLTEVKLLQDIETDLKTTKKHIRKLTNTISEAKFDVMIGGCTFDDVDSSNILEINFGLPKPTKCQLCINK